MTKAVAYIVVLYLFLLLAVFTFSDRLRHVMVTK